ncbi:insecticidal delta-endotoxin Cry8Ea1 family protein, partial [Bacillus thuringiensis]|nr:insecticidal delta-endotoxin Cry8Ea1 family protein [Bacillus thuringiensis]
MGWLWPSNNNAIWEALIRSIEALIDRQIREFERVTALSALQGLRINIAQYNTAFNNWNTNEETRNNPTLQREVISRFNIADGFFGNSMPSFRKENYEIQTLSVYAQAANLHLLLLRNAVLYGKQWEMDPLTVESHYERMVCLSGAYADHCVSFYRQGLAELRSRGNWNEFNNYRRNMTINVLDIISLFSNYDPRVYPLNTRTQLTREIYTEPLATPLWLNLRLNPTEFQQVENDFIGQPSRFTQLARLDLGVNMLTLAGAHIISRTRMFLRDNSNGFITAWQGATQINPIEQQWLDFENFNVFNIDSQISSGDRFNQNELAVGTRRALFHMVNDAGNSSATREINLQNPWHPRSITSNISGTNSATPTASDYTHKLSSIKSTRVRGLVSAANIIAYGWTYADVDRSNRLVPNRITQIPAVKGSFGTIVSGPGHTGGDILRVINNSGAQIRVESPSAQRYRIRVRYAGSRPGTLTLNHSGAGSQQFIAINLHATSDQLRFSDFTYAEATTIFQTPNNRLVYTVDVHTSSMSPVFIDRIEYIPINTTTLEYERKQHLEKAKKAVGDLFINNGKEALKVDTTDYDVDQAANLVECMPEELYTKEKMILLDEVKHAKRFSQSRNLIQNGDFEFATDGWMTSSNVIVQADNTVFKGKYLNMPGAIETDTSTFPTYIYQKIDESRLKPYTRYKVRGFVGSSHDVRLIVERNGKEVDALLNVRNDLSLDTVAPSCIEANQPYPIIHDGCLTNVIDTNSYEEAQSGHANCKKEHGMCHQSHQFDFHIDTGEIHTNKNPGIWVLFKISSPEGHATLDNIELIEDGPLVGESLALVKKRENKWK